jgi:hypothetical protein
MQQVRGPRRAARFSREASRQQEMQAASKKAARSQRGLRYDIGVATPV